MIAPKFSLQDQTGNTHSLENYAGRWVIIYFYPKDDTPGCTKEACNFRDNISSLQNLGVVVLGISKDSVESHVKFAQKYHLNFPLLSDPTAETIKAFGAWGKKKFMGKEFEGILRNTYLIGPAGEIVKTYEKVDPALHIQEVLADLQKISPTESS